MPELNKVENKLAEEIKKEQAEHPSMTSDQIQTIVSDHKKVDKTEDTVKVDPAKTNLDIDKASTTGAHIPTMPTVQNIDKPSNEKDKSENKLVSIAKTVGKAYFEH